MDMAEFLKYLCFQARLEGVVGVSIS